MLDLIGWSDRLSIDHTVQLKTSATPERRIEVCALSIVRRIAAMLDIGANVLAEEKNLPFGWHFPLLAGETLRSELRGDGFPGFGVPMPDLGLPRLLLLGRTVDYISDIPVGSVVERVSVLDKLDHKETAAGPAAIVTLRHELHVATRPEAAVVETQSYMLLGATRKVSPAATPQKIPAFVMSKVVTPDETLLFQYSALGFNSHKIHLDRAYAREVEGLPDLVVNGGLITLFLTEFLRNEMGLRPRRIRTRHKAPLYCGRLMTLTAASRIGDTVQLFAFDEVGTLATEMQAEVS
jgi:3-methylfumaryl-CoA hydratase